VRIAKLPYYARSAWALVLETSSRRALVRAAVAPPGTVSLRSGLDFAVPDRLGLLVVKETVIDDAYGLRTIPADATAIVDVGAGFGDFALFAAHLLPAATVLAFEPDPGSFAGLERTVELNGAGRIEPRRLAVGTAHSYRLTRHQHASALTATAPGGDVEARRLDALLPPGRVDLVKIDCEGGEDDVLASCSPEAMARIRQVVLEYHRGPHQAAALAATLEQHGFRTRVRPDRYDAAIGYLDGTRA
jgi:FkbM family methyltransferase